MQNLGWILSLYLDGSQIENDNDRENFPYISWSPYDRIAIYQVEEFSEFFVNQFWNRWDGVAQQMHLIPEYPLADEFNWKVSTENKKQEDYLIELEQSDKQYALNCILAVRFAEQLKNTSSLHEEVWSKIDEQVKKAFKKSDVSWAAFNSLGAEDMVFIVLADDINSFAKFSDILSKARFNIDGEEEDLFSNILSFSSLNQRVCQVNPKAKLIVRLNLRSKNQYETVKKRLLKEGIKKCDIKTLFMGKCVLDVSVEGSDILKLYRGREGIFNGQSDFYKKNVISSRSYWRIDKIDKQETESFLVNVKGQTRSNPSLEAGEKSDVNDEAKKIPVIQFVLKEYQRLIKSATCSAWRTILRVQYESIKLFVNNYVETKDNVQLYSLLKHVVSVLQHIRQATTVVTDVPYHNYMYAGSYNDILKMYYGVIATLFEIGMIMPHNENTKQHKINFCVDFEPTTEIHSTMYSLNNTDEAGVDCGERFIVFHLPFDAFSEINDTVILLSHEIFHYIAPHDRVARNEMLINLWTKVLLNRICKGYDEKIPTELMELVIKRFWNDTELYKMSYKEVTTQNEAMECCIINDFIDNAKKLRSLSLSLGLVSKEILERINSFLEKICVSDSPKSDPNFRFSKEELDSIKEYVSKMIETDITYKYVQDEMINNARAYKEVFCDVNMVKIFHMEISDYIYWFYNVSIREIKDEFIKTIEGIDKTAIQIRSLELRLCIIFDLLLKEKTSEGLSKQLQKCREKAENDKDFIYFLDYCQTIYNLYLSSLRLFRDSYTMLFTDLLDYWQESSHDLSKLLTDFDSINNLENNIVENVEFVQKFLNKEQIKVNNHRSRNTNKLAIIQPEMYLGKLTTHDGPCVSDLGEYINVVCRLTEKVEGVSSEYEKQCWYRGVCNKNHSLLPGLHRLYNNKADYEKVNMAPYVKQAEILKDAYFLTLNMPSLWTEQLQGVAEHMCCLQHYGMVTNLLDFSLDMLVALHFALNPDNKDDLEAMNAYKSVPEVIIFNPAKYNAAIMELSQGCVGQHRNYRQPSPVMFDIFDKNMEDYFVGDMTAKRFVEENRDFYEDVYVPDIRLNKYPMPIIIRQSNSRILAQNGIFMAYNLHAKIDKEKMDFSYLDLNNIQDAYLQLCGGAAEKNNMKFLEKIYIDPPAIPSLRESLKKLGINTGKMYPELSKIFDQYREQNK